MTYNRKEFLKWMLTPSASHSMLMENDKKYSEGFRNSLLCRYPEIFKDSKEKERIPLTPYIPIREIPQLLEEIKMPINNIYESIEVIYETLMHELSMQGIDCEIINTIMSDIIESMNRNIKWTLNKG